MGGYHLIDRLAFGELRIQLPAEFADSAGSDFESFADSGIDVFHGWGAPSERRSKVVSVDEGNRNRASREYAT